jgi:hypothetical protein
MALATVNTKALPLISLSVNYEIALSMVNSTDTTITDHPSYGNTTAAHS